MYLKKLELFGFKSFADRTELAFQPGMTGIVGPNGAGKSNIVDAFKWIFGEQSAKVMRGGEMKDVIFNGTQDRRPSGFAEVTIVFENSDRFLDVDYSEVAVTRRLYRSGESEYLINKQKARLKDIRELFMGTGIGQTSYSMLEQGRIDVILQASEVDRRFVFEEAAGISKYLARKAEALRALLRVEENLTRLNDIVDEVDKRLQRVKAQASKARRHRELTERLKELRVRSTLDEWKGSLRARADLSFRLSWCDLRLADLDSLIASASEACAAKARERRELAERIRGLDERLAEERMLEERTRERVNQARERLAELEGEKVRRGEELRSSREGLAALEARLAAEREKLSSLAEDAGAKRARCADLAAELEAVRSAREGAEVDLRARREDLVDLLQRRAALKNQIVSIESEIGNLAGQRERLSALVEGLEAQLELVRGKLSEEKGRLEALEAEEKGLRARLAETSAGLAGLEARAAELDADLSAVREETGVRRSRYEVLKNLEEDLAGVRLGVADLLRRKAERSAVEGGIPGLAEVHGMVGSFVEVEPRFAMAVESALAERAQSLIVETQDGAFGLLDFARAERLGALEIVSLDRVGPARPEEFPRGAGVLGPLRERVSVPDDYGDLFDRLLANVILVEDRAAALALSRNGLRSFRLVTLEGELLEPWGGLSVPGERGAGIISRRSEIAELEGELRRLEARKEAVEAEREAQRRRIEEVEAERRDLEDRVSRLGVSKVQAEGSVEQLSREAQRIGREIAVGGSELADLVEQSKAREAERASVAAALASQEVEIRSAEETVQLLDGEVSRRSQEERAAGERLTQARLELAQAEKSEEGLRELVSRLEATVSEHRSRSENVALELEGLERRREELERTVETGEAELSAVGERQAGIRSELEVEERLEREALQAEGAFQKALESLHAERSAVSSERQSAELRDQEERHRRNSLAERIAEDYALDVERLLEFEAQAAEVARGLDAGAPEAGAAGPDLDALPQALAARGLPPESRYLIPDPEFDREKAREEIRELQEKIRRLGAVNLEALEELQELEERSRFQKAQRADLLESEKNLREIIAEINKTSRELFLKTFQEIQGHFSDLFRKCFGGGKAELVLEEGADVLEAGIDIVARPPGKKVSRLSLMSGGEKTMTAIALLFAIFRTRPSPFCILDEVDAALDEANVRRFVVLLKDFLARTQFIVVTHNKLTMMEASTLYGITMEERGVSKRVSVELATYDPETLEAAAPR